MLFLQPPYQIIEGIVIYRDHANEQQFYYLPAVPRISTQMDAELGVELPKISMIKYRDAGIQGSFLNLEVNLGVSNEKLDEISSQLRATHQLAERPLLSPVLIESGTVRLIGLGHKEQSADADEDQERDVNDFEIIVDQAVSPALYGDNQAIFSLQLDARTTQIVEATMGGDMLPIGIIYALDYYALRPAFNVKITADWSRVQDHFQESFGVEAFFYQQQIDEIVDSLIEERVINIEVDSFLPEGEDAGSWVGRRDQAIDELKDLVLESFFEPSLNPIMEEEDNWDKVVDFAYRMANYSPFTYKYTRVEQTRIDEKRLDAQMSERITVLKTIFPQAHLSGLNQVLRDTGLDMTHFIRSVTLNDPWFQTRSVTAHALLDFDHDSVESVNITLRYGSDIQTLRLTVDTPTLSAQWPTLVDATGTASRFVEMNYKVNFHNVDAAERPVSIESQSFEITGTNFEISPGADQAYFVDDVVIGADLLPWQRYPRVAVDVFYVDEANGIQLSESFMLSSTNPEVTWRRFRVNPILNEYQIRVTYLAANNRDIVRDWIVTKQDRFLVRDPRPATRTLQIVPAIDWRIASMVLIELNYRDDDNDIDEYRTLSFMDTPEERGPKSFSVNLSDPDKRLISYDTSILLTDNRLIRIPKSTTVASAIFLRADMAGHRIVSVTPAELDFPEHGIVKVEAAMSYEDLEAGLSFDETFSFHSADDVSYFEFDYVEENRSSYECQVKIQYVNGMSKLSELGSLNGDSVILPVS